MSKVADSIRRGLIEAVAFAEFSGDQPVIATFNPSEKKSVAQLESGSRRQALAPCWPRSTRGFRSSIS